MSDVLISEHEDANAKSTDWNCAKLKVKLTNKNNQTAKCASYKGTESNRNIVMPKFHWLRGENYIHSYSGSHTITIAYSDLQDYMTNIRIINVKRIVK